MNRIKDCNGVGIHTGDIVEITGDYVKKNNCLYVVEASPGDPGWSDEHLSLIRISKSGKMATSNRIGFWPVIHFSRSDYRMRQKAVNGGWKEEDIKIRIASVRSLDEVARYFMRESKKTLELAEKESMMGFKQMEEESRIKSAHLQAVAEKVRARG